MSSVSIHHLAKVVFLFFLSGAGCRGFDEDEYTDHCRSSEPRMVEGGTDNPSNMTSEQRSEPRRAANDTVSTGYAPIVFALSNAK